MFLGLILQECVPPWYRSSTSIQVFKGTSNIFIWHSLSWDFVSQWINARIINWLWIHHWLWSCCFQFKGFWVLICENITFYFNKPKLQLYTRGCTLEVRTPVFAFLLWIQKNRQWAMENLDNMEHVSEHVRAEFDIVVFHKECSDSQQNIQKCPFQHH